MSILLLLRQTAAAPKVLTPESGSFSCVGNEATIRIGRRIAADSQTYTEDLKPANVLRSRYIFGNAGRYTLSDQLKYRDTFSYANGNLSTVSSGIWVSRSGTLTVSNSEIFGSTADSYSEISTSTYDFSDNQEAEILVTATGTGDIIGPAVRMTASGCYSLFVDGGNFSNRRIVRLDGTVETVIGNVNIPCIVGDTLKIRVVGNQISAYVNNVLVNTVTDNTYTTGQPGIFYNRGNVNRTRGDNFVAYSISEDSVLLKIGRRISADTQTYTEDLKPANLYKSITAPTDIAQGIKGWFDASNRSSLTVSSNNLTVWNDLSGQNDHLDTIQGNNPKSGLRTISGKNAIEFNDDGAIYDFDTTGGTTAPGATIAMVFVADTINGTIVSSRTTLDTKIRLDSSSKLVMYGGSSNQAASTRNITTSQIYTAIGIFTGTTSKLWINGVSEDMSIASEDRILIAMIGAGGAGDTDYFDGLVGEVAIYENALSDSEALSLHNYLYKKWVLEKTILSDTSSYSFNGGDANIIIGRKLVADTRSYSLVGNDVTLTKAGGAKIITADTQSYSISGSANLIVSRKLLADVQTYNENLQPANLLRNRRLVADVQTYNENLQPANLLRSRRLVADVQTYNEDLKAANLLRSRRLVADVQTYNENLQPANILRNRRLVADVQTYNENLQPANLLRTRRLVADTQTYNENLQPANLLRNRRLVADVQTYNENLQPANLRVSRKLLAAVQSYNEDLKPANLITTRKLLAAVQSYNENLQPANLRIGRKLLAAQQTYNENLQPANLFRGRRLTADVRSYTFDGKPANFPITRKLISDKSTYTLIGNSLNFQTLGKLTADVRSYSLTGQNVGLRVTRRLVSDTQSYTFLGKDANIKIGRKISANISAYILSGNDAGVLRGRKLTADFSSYALSGKTANFPLGRRLIADRRTYSLSGNNAGLLSSRKLPLAAQSYSFLGKDTAFKRTYKVKGEGARTNYVTNSEMVGAVVGVLGSGGSMPSGWTSGFGAYPGITREVVAIGARPDGSSYIDLRISGTNSSGVTIYPDLYFSSSSTFPEASIGQTWSASAYIEHIAGSRTGFSSSISKIAVSERNSSGFLAATPGSTVTAGRSTATRVFNNIATTNAALYYDLSIPNGSTVDFTFRISAPQLERSAAATAYIPTTGTVVRKWYETSLQAATLKLGRKIPISVANYNFTFNQLLFSRGGFIKVWTGTAWASKPLKVWNGTAWVSKPLKIWNGTTWRTF